MKAYLGETVAFLVDGVEKEGHVTGKNNGGYWIKADNGDMHRVEEGVIIRIIKWSHERHQAVASELRRRQNE